MSSQQGLGKSCVLAFCSGTAPRKLYRNGCRLSHSTSIILRGVISGLFRQGKFYVGSKGSPARRGNSSSLHRGKRRWRAGLRAQYLSQAAAALSKTRRRIRAGPEVPGAGGREEEPCESTPPPRARALAGWGWGWSRNSEAGARTGPGPGRGGCAGAGAAEAAAPGGGFVYPGEEV